MLLETKNRLMNFYLVYYYSCMAVDAGQCFIHDMTDTGIWYLPWIEHVNNENVLRRNMI